MNSKQRRREQRSAPSSAQTFSREFRLSGDLDTEARTVSASLSSTLPVKRVFGDEVLSHDLGSVDLSRAQDGLPLLWSHDRQSPIGIVEGVHVEGDRLRGVLRFSRSSRGEEVMSDVRDGILKSMSIGYTVDSWAEDKKSRTKTATRWTPFEASVVSVPADHSVGVNRSKEDTSVSDETQGREASDENTTAVNVVDYGRARDAALREGVERGARMERERVDGIRSIFQKFGDNRAQEIEAECIRRGTSVEDAKTALLDLLGSGVTPTGSREHTADRETASTRVEHRADAIDKAARGMEDAILLRSGMLTDKAKVAEVRAAGYAGMSLAEMAREWCRVAGVPTTGDKRQIIGRSFTRAVTHGTSDFTSVLANITTKSLMMGYEEAPETWQAWCRIGSLPDFKQAYRVQTSAFGDLGTLTENGEYTYGTVADHHEPLTLASYGKMFSISRQAIVNDDVSAFTTTARGMGRAAARKVGDLAYAVLTGGTSTTLTQDGVNLFSVATHANYVSSGAVPSVTTLNAGYASMAIQTDPSGAAYLNITPSVIIAPHALRGTILQLIQSSTVPASPADSGDNIWRAALNAVFDARLDAYDAAGWYLAGNPSQFDTVEVAFLDGQQSPYLEEREGWNVDGVEYKVRIDAVAKALDFRALYRNDGN